jgi:hypothetical protein
MKISKELIEKIIKEEVDKATSARLPTDVARASDRLDKVPSLDALLQKIDTPKELEQFLVLVVKKVQVDPNLLRSTFAKVVKALEGK